MSFYDELEKGVREAWLLDRKRIVKESIELAVCTVFFIIAVILMFLL